MPLSHRVHRSYWLALVFAICALVCPPAGTVASQPIVSGQPRPLQALPDISQGVISDDGRYWAFTTKEALVAEDTNGVNDVYVQRRGTSEIVRVSLQPDGSQFVGKADYPDISENGRYIVYQIGELEPYLYDRDTDDDGEYDESGSTRMVWLAQNISGHLETGCNGPTGPVISADGGSVVIEECYQKPTWGGETGIFLIYTDTLASLLITNGSYPEISGDGRYILYDLLQNSIYATYRWDRDVDGDGRYDEGEAQTPLLVSVNSSEESANTSSGHYSDATTSTPADISRDGRYVIFSSFATNLEPNKRVISSNVYLRDIQAGTTELVSLSNQGDALSDNSIPGSVSADGRYVSFYSASDAVVEGDEAFTTDLFVRDRVLNTTTRLTGLAGANMDVYLRERADRVLTVNGPLEGAANETYQFSATLGMKTVDFPVSYTWVITDQSPAVITGANQAIDQMTLQWDSPGEKTIQVIARGAGGWEVSDARTFTVYAPPQAGFAPESVTDYGDGTFRVSYTDLSSGRINAIGGYWDYGNGDGGFYNGEDYSKPGRYPVTQTVAGPGGVTSVTHPITLPEGAQNPIDRSRAFINFGYLGTQLVGYHSSAWGDYDRDGDVDLLVSGCNKYWDIHEDICIQAFTQIYQNQNGYFVNIHAGFVPRDGSVAWEDFDRDGYLDVLMVGPYGNSGSVFIYRNLHNGAFELLNVSGLPLAVPDRKLFLWLDYDSDGDLDMATGRDLYRNQGGNYQKLAGIIPGIGKTFAWGDYDGDQDLDLFTIYADQTHLYRNDGFRFTDVPTEVPGLRNGLVSWTDIDQDGDQDLLVVAQGASSWTRAVYTNTNGSLTASSMDASAIMVSVERPAQAHWADYDNDGDIDLSVDDRVYQNTGTGFTGVPVPIYTVDDNMLIANNWIDYNQDGRLDVGSSWGYGPTIYPVPYMGMLSTWINQSDVPNNPPSTPANLRVENTATGVAFRWDSSTDDHTPAGGLTYDVRIGTSPGGSDVFAVNADLATGKRLVFAPGNAGGGTNFQPALPSGQTYYWSVQAIDGALAGSGFAAEQQITIDAQPITGVTINGLTTEFPGTAATFTAVLQPGNALAPVTYTWTATGQSLVIHENVTAMTDSASFTWPASGSMAVSVTATNSLGEASNTHTIEITSRPRPDFAAGSVSGADPFTVVFSNSTTGTATEWAWDFGDGETSTAQSPNHTYQNPGTYSVSLTATGPDGSNTITKTDYIRVYQHVTASFSVAPATCGLAPFQVSFTNSSTGDIGSVDWSFGDESTSTEISPPAHTYTTVGNYLVRLTVTGLGRDQEWANQPIIVANPAQAGFTADKQSAISTLAVRFTNTTQGAYTTSSWDFGDGETSTERDPLHTYDQPGTYTVKLSVNGCGGADSEEKVGYITVYAPVQAKLNASVTKGTAPLEVTFTSQSIGDFTTLAWDPGDGGEGGAQASFTHTYPAPGTYTATLTTDGPGGLSVAQQVIQVYRPVQAAFLAERGTAACSIDFTSSSAGDVDHVAWNFGDGQTSTEANPSHTYAACGDYSVTLQVYGAGGDDDALTQTVHVYAGPVAAFTADRTSGVAPLEVRFTDQSQGVIETWAWEFGDGGTGSAQNPTHSYAQPGAYTVRLTVTGPGGAGTRTLLKYINVYTQVQAALGASTNQGILPLQVTFTPQASGSYTTLTWYPGDGGATIPVTSGQAFSHTYTQNGTFIAKLTANGPGGQVLANQVITVFTKVHASFYAYLFSIDAPRTFQFTNNSSGDYTACEWDFGDGTPKVTDCAPQHQYASTGAYQACLSLTGPGGEDQSCVNLSIPEVEANFSADRVSGPAPLLVNFIQLSSNGFQYLWDFGDGGTSDSPQPVHVYEQPGAYTVTLTAKGYGGEDTLTMEDFIYVGLGRFRLYVPMLTR